jgi:hypothetical protein
MTHHFPRALIVSGILLLAACNPQEETAPEPDVPAAEPITITNVQMGDMACYFMLETGESQMASFDLCDPGLAGTRHVPTYEEVSVQSPECEGDPECTLTVTERLVVDLAPMAQDQP